jgi:hypothetical protein
VAGYVTNLSGQDYIVDGAVRFRFETDRFVTLPEYAIFASARVPAGQRSLVARLSLPFTLHPTDRCMFDARGAVNRR